MKGQKYYVAPIITRILPESDHVIDTLLEVMKMSHFCLKKLKILFIRQLQAKPKSDNADFLLKYMNARKINQITAHRELLKYREKEDLSQDEEDYNKMMDVTT